MIELKNISKQLDDHTILKDLSLTIEEGKIYGLVGPNGVGKSTLLRLMSGILIADEGTIQVNGKDFNQDHRFKKEIIYVSDDPYFFGMNTLKELRQFYRIFYPGFNETVYYRLLNHFHVNEKAKISDFSKGMKRQISLILGLSLNPKVLLLDEAFDGLDPVMRKNLIEYLLNETTEKKLSVIIASHNIRDLEDICDEIFLLYNGYITSMGNKEHPQTNLCLYQLHFSNPVNLKEIESLPSLVYYVGKEKDINVILSEKNNDAIKKLKPITSKEIALNLEEVFVYTLKEQGYGKLI